MLAAGWPVRRIREATHIHPKTIAKFRRQWQPVQSDPPVSTGDYSPADTPNHLAEPVLAIQSDPQVSTEVLVDPLRASTQSGQLMGLVDVIAALLEIAPEASARWVWQKLVEHHDYAGSERSVSRYLQKLRRTSPTFFLRRPPRLGDVATLCCHLDCALLEPGIVRPTLRFGLIFHDSNLPDHSLRQEGDIPVRYLESQAYCTRQSRIDRANPDVLSLLRQKQKYSAPTINKKKFAAPNELYVHPFPYKTVADSSPPKMRNSNAAATTNPVPLYCIHSHSRAHHQNYTSAC